MIKYCKSCLLPSTKPHLTFDAAGVCDACNNFKSRGEIDWNARGIEFQMILDKFRSRDGSWDCVVPVSGEK